MYRRTLLAALGAGPFATDLDWGVHDQTSTHSSGSLPTPSPDRVDFGQYGGGPGNTKHFQADESPTGIVHAETLVTTEELSDEAEEVIDDAVLDKAPVVSGEGDVFAPGIEVAVSMKDGGEPQIINLQGYASTALIIDDHAYVGDHTSSSKIDIETGEIVDEIDGSARAFKSMIGAETVTAYQSIGGGFAEFDHEDMEINEEWMQDTGLRNPTGHGFVPFEEDGYAAISLGGTVQIWDLENDELAEGTGMAATSGISSDEEIVIAHDRRDDYIKAMDTEIGSIEVIDELKHSGEIERPMNILDEGDGVRSVYGVDVDGTAFRAEFDGDEEVLEMEWETELEGSGYDAIVWGDTLVTGTDQELALLERKTGNVIERCEEYAGVPSMPHGNRLYVAAEDGGLLQVKLQIGEPTVGDYANDEGIVDPTGLRDATDDWRSSVIELDLLRDVIAAWQSGESLD